MRSGSPLKIIFEEGKAFRTLSIANGSTNGSARRQQDKVRVAIIGVGNCANSFVQGVHYYRDTDPASRSRG